MFYIFVFSSCFGFMLILYYPNPNFIDLYLVLVYNWYFTDLMIDFCQKYMFT